MFPAIASVSRRSFLQTSAVLTVTATLPALSQAGTALVPDPTAIDGDLLAALGERLARDAVSQLDARGHAVIVHYRDCAAPTLSMLREGLLRGFAFEGATVRAWQDACGNAGPVVARLTVEDAVTGRTVLAEIDATTLSVVAMIEEAAASPVTRKQALLLARSEDLYRIAPVA
ncbi:MAG: twin-arginine translocation signal domain-containing protein [Casimicrobiaceae bacterium]